MAATFGGMLGYAVASAAVGAVLQTASALASNEGMQYTGQESMFTYSSIAPSSMRLHKDNKMIDKNLKIILAMTVIELQKIVGKTKVPEWGDIVSIMSQNALFEKCGESSRHGIRTYTHERDEWFKSNYKPDQGTVDKIKIWFTKEIDDIDPELKKLTGVLKNDIFTNLATIVATTGAESQDIATMIMHSNNVEVTLADVGLIRYPSYENPKVKIFRLKIKSWRNCDRTWAIHQASKNGLTVEIDSQEYMPREEVVSRMRDRVLSEEDVEYLCDKADSVLLKI
jgi:hypothetical protein